MRRMSRRPLSLASEQGCRSKLDIRPAFIIHEENSGGLASDRKSTIVPTTAGVPKAPSREGSGQTAFRTRSKGESP